MSELRTAEAFSVGSFIGEELRARGWSVQEFVTRMYPIRSVEQRGLDMLAVEFLLNVEDPALRMGDMAGPMARALGVSPEFLLKLERAFISSRSPLSSGHTDTKGEGNGR